MTDVLDVVTIGKEAHLESRWSDKEYTPLHCIDAIKHCLNEGAAFVDVEDGSITGWIWGHYAKNIFVDSMQATCISLYVRPQYRNSNRGLKLVQEFIKKAKEDKIDEILLGTNSMKEEKDREAVITIYKRAGAKPYSSGWGVL